MSEYPYAKSDTVPATNALVVGGYDLVDDTVTLLTGQNLKRGALLGKVTASGKFVLSAAAAGDGSQTPIAVLADDVDATAADKAAPIYRAGGFNANQIIYGAGHTFASVKEALNARGIHLLKATPA